MLLYSGETAGEQIHPTNLQKFKMYLMKSEEGKMHRIFILRIEDNFIKARDMKNNEIIRNININDYLFYATKD